MLSTVLRSVSKICFRSLSSAPASTLISHTQENILEEEETSPFYFGKTTHILGYTGLIPNTVPQLCPEAYQEHLAVVKAKFEDRSLGSYHMLNLVFACSNLDEIETFLDFARMYRRTIFPQIPTLPIALTRTLIHLNSPETALDIFQRHSEFAIFPSSFPIAVLIDGLLKQEQFELALDAYELLDTVFSPIRNEAIAVGAIAHVCEGSESLMIEARELFVKLVLSEWRYTPEALKILFIILKRQNRDLEVKRLTQEFESLGYLRFDYELGEFVVKESL